MCIFQNESNFKKNNLNYIDDAFLHAKSILKDISDDRKECLQTLVQSKDFIQWTKQELKGTEISFFDY